MEELLRKILRELQTTNALLALRHTTQDHTSTSKGGRADIHAELERNAKSRLQDAARISLEMLK